MIFGAHNWDCGDSVAEHALFKILPQLNDCEVVYAGEDPNDLDRIEEVLSADYIIRPGTPSWMSGEVSLHVWRECIRRKKDLYLLGIGCGIKETGDFSFRAKEVTELIESGVLKLAICRDRLTYFWLRKLGAPAGIVHLLPCPGFYLMGRPDGPVRFKRKVALDLVNPDYCSHTTRETFSGYFDKMKYLLEALESRGASVMLGFQRNKGNPAFKSFEVMFNQHFPDRALHWFRTQETFEYYYNSREIYIGARVHGALPCSGSGMPCFGLGVDARQFAWEQVPFIARADIRYVDEWYVDFILQWYDALHPLSISESLVDYKRITLQAWREKTSCLKF